MKGLDNPWVFASLGFAFWTYFIVFIGPPGITRYQMALYTLTGVPAIVFFSMAVFGLMNRRSKSNPEDKRDS